MARLSFLFVFFILASSCDNRPEYEKYDPLNIGETWKDKPFDLKGRWVATESVYVDIANGAYTACYISQCDEGVVEFPGKYEIHLVGFRDTRLWEHMQRIGYVSDLPSSRRAQLGYSDFSPNRYGGSCRDTPCRYIGRADNHQGYLFKLETVSTVD